VKLFLDENITYRVIRKITEYYPECKHATDVIKGKLSDKLIWDYAKENGYTIVTFDSDFSDLVSMNGCPPKVIWLRIGNTTNLNLINFFINKQEAIKDFILNPINKDFCCLEFE
jgi:predicted nuclease of predicted toxin-antitoxin system